MEFQTPYNHTQKPKFASALPSMTLQQFKEECDINHLIDRYKRTGSYYDPLSVVGGSRRVPTFTDISELPDVTEAMNTIRDAQEFFMSLPAETRLAFNNDVASFVAFAQDPANIEKCVELGIFARSEVTPTSPQPSEGTEANIEGANAPAVTVQENSPAE